MWPFQLLILLVLYLIRFGILPVFLISGCTIHHALQIPRLPRDGKDVLEEKISRLKSAIEKSDSPVRARISVHRSFFEDNEPGFQIAVRHGNFFLQTWPGHLYAAEIGNRAAWGALFLLRPVDPQNPRLLDLWLENIIVLVLARDFARQSGRLDRDEERFYAREAYDLERLVNEGHYNVDALIRFLDGKRDLMIRMRNTNDSSYCREAIRKFRAIRENFPSWQPKLVEQFIDECEKVLGRARREN